jgi:hypothetical protein
MKQHKPKKLQLTKESLRTLTRVQLEEVAGGINTTSNGGGTCASVCIAGCPSVPC